MLLIADSTLIPPTLTPSMKPSDAPLETLFFRVGKSHRKIAGRLLEQHCFHRGQTPLIFALSHEDGRTNSELAELLEVTPATITNMVKRMEKAGLQDVRFKPLTFGVATIYEGTKPD